jgi:hypothetical protein
MKITTKHIALFKDAYLEEYKETITDNDAEIMILEFLRLLEILSSPLPNVESMPLENL